MRLWSIHPRYLDRQGLLAVWREGLLAKKVLAGRTKGYKNHPQLERFKSSPRPQAAINTYLWHIFQEAARRGYNFSRLKINGPRLTKLLKVTKGQLKYELQHLKNKLKIRDPKQGSSLASLKKIESHPFFRVVSGQVAPWEKIK